MIKKELTELEEEKRLTKEKTIQLSKKYRLKYDSLCNKWIEESRINKKAESKNFGQERWERITGYFPTYEWLLWDFTIRKTAKAELKDVHQLIENMAETEKLVSAFAKKIGAELDRKANGIK